MIQDSINQMLATAAIGTKLLSGGIAEAKGIKMENLTAQQEKNLAKLAPGEGNSDEVAFFDDEAKKRLSDVATTQHKMDKLGKSKFFPNAKAKQMANQYGSRTDEAIQRFRGEAGANEFSRENLPGYNARILAIQRAQSGAMLKQQQAKEFFGNRFKVDQPDEELIKAIQGGRD